jgi:acyl carrier protein
MSTAVNDTHEVVQELLTGIIGEDFIEEYDLGLESTLTGDLEMESIEIVEFAEKVKAKYGNNANMSEWIAKLSLDQLIALSIGDVVEFIDNANS